MQVRAALVQQPHFGDGDVVAGGVLDQVHGLVGQVIRVSLETGRIVKSLARL